jgi:hypothetical protein
MPRPRRPLKLAYLALPALAVFLAVYLLGLTPAGGDSGSASPVRIESVQINSLPDTSPPYIEVEIELKNHDQAAHEVKAWWFLSRIRAPEPWNFYAFRSSAQAQVLAPGEKTTLQWDEEVTAEPGTYELSAWVHTAEGDTTHHSDGERVGSPTVYIDSQWSRFSRRVTPPPGLRVTAVDLPSAALDSGLNMPIELPLIIAVNNRTATETVADVQWFLYRRTSRLPWNDKPVYTSEQLQHQVFAPKHQTILRTSEPISLWPGEYLLRLVVTGTDSEGNAISDDIFLNDALTLVESANKAAIIRAGPTSGPVEIASLTADTGGFQRGRGSVTVSLRNRSDSRQEAILWWFLSRPGTLQPWVEFDLRSRVFGASIASQQQAVLELSDDASLPPGTYELSVWVHTLDTAGDEHPSDGVWFNQRIEIQ